MNRALWYLRAEAGEIIGPFPGPMIIRHRLLGRVKPMDEASQDRVEWKVVADIPELQPAAPKALAEPLEDDAFWSTERAKAKLRWADERVGGDRRTGNVPTQSQIDARSGNDRRASSSTFPTQRDPLKLHGDGRRKWVAVVTVLVGCAALVGGLIWLGTVTEPVNPLKVTITR